MRENADREASPFFGMRRYRAKHRLDIGQILEMVRVIGSHAASGQDRMDHLAAHIGQAEVPPLVLEREPLVVDAEQM